MKTRLFDHLALGAIGASAMVTAALYSRLPAQVPVHFDLHGVADGFMPRHIGAWLLPGLGLLVWLFMRCAVLLPERMRARMEGPAIRLVVDLVVLLFAMLQCVVLYSALHEGQSVGGALGLLLATFWIVLGLLMPRLRRNRWVGIRTPWTLASDQVWARTHRFGGATMVVSGVLALIALALGRPSLAIVSIIASSLVAIIYSAVVAHQVPPAS